MTEPVLRLYTGPVPEKAEDADPSKLLAESDPTYGLAEIHRAMQSILDQTVKPTTHYLILPARGGLRYLGVAAKSGRWPQGWWFVDGGLMHWRKAKRLLRKKRKDKA